MFDAFSDCIGERRYADELIQCEVVTHGGDDALPQVFATFFGVVFAELREACGALWTSPIQGAWDPLLCELDFYVQNPATS